MRVRPAWTLAVVVALCVHVPVAQAEIYRWTDDNGKVHFSDRPARGAKAEKVEVRVNTYESVSYDRSIFDTKREVVMYSAEWCGVCDRAKAYFRAEGIPFKEHDIDKSRKARADFDRLGGRGVPVILVGRQRMNGFSPRAFQGMYDRGN